MKKEATITKTENIDLNKFSYENFYSEANTKIIENILDCSYISLHDLEYIFEIEENKTVTFLQSIISKWLEKEKKGMLTLDPFCEVLEDTNDRHNPIKKTTRFSTDSTLPILINEGILPKELCRLPRYRSEVIGFKPLPTFYGEYCQDLNLDAEEIINNPVNLIQERAVTLTYMEAIKLLRSRGKYKSELENACLANILGVYLKIEEKNLMTSARLKDRVQSINSYRTENCGNPFYTKRYPGLDRLPISDKIGLFKMETLFNPNSRVFTSDKTTGYFLIELQTTDFETKFHVKRLLTSYCGHWKIELKDLLFIKEELENLIEDLNTAKNEQNLKQTENETNLHNTSPLYNRTFQNLEAIYIKYKENDPYDSSSFVLKRLKNKAAKEGVALILQMITEASQKIGEEFDPLKMRGQRHEFHLFIENLYPKLYNKSERQSLYEILTGKGRKTDPMVGWDGWDAKSETNFWKKIQEEFSLPNNK